MARIEPAKEAQSRLQQLLAAEQKQGATQTMVRIRPETKALLNELKRQTGLSFTSIIHVALTLMSEREVE